jgi:uroporphyrin-III C-methyltransferase / precorrin-2 dehydrogenase / sirohydrochlorin ferrochelatase
MYPVSLNVKNRRCLVVGGGSVALRKVEGLLAEEALVFVVTSKIDAPLQALADKGKIHVELRKYKPGDASKYQLIFAATNDREVNRQIFEDANSSNLFANVSDDPELCSFHLPARVNRGSLQLAIASAGEAPFVVRRLRQLLERRFGAEWGEWIQAAARFRCTVLEMDLSPTTRERLFDAFFDATIDPDGLHARVPTTQEITTLLEHNQGNMASTQAGISPKVSSNSSTESGLVSLVGAGPGDPGLLTLRGRERLLAADVVVCDRLAITSLPCDLPDHIEIKFVGKTSGRHPVPQDEINTMLARLSQDGKRVVRFKGGDPYVFGRGGEEAEVLVSNNVPFEVVPGVTAATAVPAYAGIPVTFRNEVVRVTMVTAHEAEKTGGPQVRWDLLATDPHAILLGYMGVTALPNVVARLLDAGMNPDTPAALIERGTTSCQKTVVSTVANFLADIKKSGLKPPGLFAIGASIKHANNLDWFGIRPLLGERLVITSSSHKTKETLELKGAEVLEVTSPITPVARLVMDALPLTGCVARNVDDVLTIDEERDAPSWTANAVSWCTSPAAAKQALSLGWQNVVEIESTTDVSFLIEAMIERRSSTK